MLADLTLALLAAALVGVVPGWFWAVWLLPRKSPLSVRLAYAAALSLVLVPAATLVVVRFSGGVTLPAALLAPLLVLWAGVGGHFLFGPNRSPEEAVADPPPPLNLPTLVPTAGALTIALAAWLATFQVRREAGAGILADPPVLPLVLSLLAAGAVYLASGLLASRRSASGGGTSAGADETPAKDVLPASAPAVLRRLAPRLALPAVLALVLVRGYSGPVLHDWPHVRGVDLYSHAVMANLMMERGEIEPYLIYPPGFHATSAVLSRLTGLDPLGLFAALGPALLVLPALACYVLARRLWGHAYGVAAALFAGLILGGSYQYFRDAMYPNLVAAQFLMVLALCALFSLYRSPSWRSGLLLAALGSGVFLYHQVSALYLALVLGFAGVAVLPGLLRREDGRERGLAVLLSLAVLGILAVAAVWQTYDLGRVAGAVLGSAAVAGPTGEAVGMAIGSQLPRTPGRLIWSDLSSPVAWLGLMGALLLPGAWWARRGSPAALAYLTLAFWALLLFAGSRTSLSGFPERFGRDLGVPLSVLAALALVTLIRSLAPRPAPLGAATACVAALAMLLAGTLVGVQAVRSLEIGAGPSRQLLMTPEIAAAGEWLEENNRGGNIVVSPHSNQVPGRMMLALGDYSALQSYAPHQVLAPRDLPPTGAGPLWDVLRVVKNPDDGGVPRLLERHDVRYVVLYKDFPGRLVEPYWLAFKGLPELYPAVFENGDVFIVSTGPARELAPEPTAGPRSL